MSHSHPESNCSTSRRVVFALAVGLVALLDSAAFAAANAKSAVYETHKAGDATVINLDRESSISLSRNPCDRYVVASTNSGSETVGTIVAAKCETPPPRRRPCYL